MEEEVNQIEDVTPVEEVRNEETGLTDKEEKFLRSAVVNRYSYHLTEIYKYLKSKKLNISQLINEINDKKCGLSSAQRAFVVGFKPEFISALLNDMFNYEDNSVE